MRHLAFQVENVDAKLAEMGAAAVVTLGPFSFQDFFLGWRTVWIKDPDGNIVEISQRFVDQPNPPPLDGLPTLPGIAVPLGDVAASLVLGTPD